MAKKLLSKIKALGDDIINNIKEKQKQNSKIRDEFNKAKYKAQLKQAKVNGTKRGKEGNPILKMATDLMQQKPAGKKKKQTQKPNSQFNVFDWQ